MEKPEEEYVEFVIKDFNVHSPNGNMYNLDANCSQLAIQQFIGKHHTYGEKNHPSFTDAESDDCIKRMGEIDLNNVAVHITDLRYDEKTKQIIGKVKPFPKVYKDLIEDLKLNKIAFGMRSLCFPYKKEGEEKTIYDIDKIITFDIISTDKPNIE